MIVIKHKRFLRKSKTFSYNAWNECSQNDLIALFKILGSRWYNESDRLAINEFLCTPESSEVFPVKQIGKFYGPADQLRNMTFGQWSYIERKMFDLSQNSNSDNANSLMACLFTPKNSIFSSEMARHNKNSFKALPKHYFNAAVRCWDAQRRWCYSLYPWVFPVSSGESVQKSAPEYVKIMRSFAGSPADSDIIKIFNSNVHSILSALNDELTPKKKR